MTRSGDAEPLDGGRPILVVSAHAADFAWRSGGLIALAATSGRPVRVVCLSFGERGESQGAWKQPGITLEEVKALRRREAEAAAIDLGAEIVFLDGGDYPLGASEELLDELIEQMRAWQPCLILTHSSSDPYNDDHAVAAHLTLKARMAAQAAGRQSATLPLGAPNVYRFEPHQPEMCGFMPNVLVDISSVFERKLRAMQRMEAQEHLVRYYSELAVRRGVQAVRNGGPTTITHAEAYERVFPHVMTELP